MLARRPANNSVAPDSFRGFHAVLLGILERLEDAVDRSISIRTDPTSAVYCDLKSAFRDVEGLMGDCTSWVDFRRTLVQAGEGDPHSTWLLSWLGAAIQLLWENATHDDRRELLAIALKHHSDALTDYSRGASLGFDDFIFHLNAELLVRAVEAGGGAEAPCAVEAYLELLISMVWDARFVEYLIVRAVESAANGPVGAALSVLQDDKGLERCLECL
eukprot:Sspe_Gene.54935::Locus_30262_Transcript_1_8_Confidence_0.167_Length_982::g.54935::m.54935